MSPVDSEDVLDVLSGLVDKSLVVYEEQPDGTGRYRLLETVRQYARERLAEGGEAEAVQGRAAAWFLALAEEAEPQLRGPEQASWLGRLEAEHDNLRASLAWEERRAEGGEDGLRLVGALWLFWWVRGHYTEGRQWLGRALARTTPGTMGLDGATSREPSAARATALLGAGSLAYSQGDYAGARALHEEGLTIRRRLGDQSGIANALSNLGIVAWAQGDYAGARALHEEGLTIRRRLGDQRGIAASLSNLGLVAYTQGDYAGARALQQESLILHQQLGDQQGIANLLINLGLVAERQGDYAGARALQQESLTIQRRLGDQSGIANALGNLGTVAWAQGDYAGARALHEEGLTIRRRLGDQRGIAASLSNLGIVASAQGDYAGARALQQESLILYRQLGNQQGISYALGNLGTVAFRQGDYAEARALQQESLTILRQLGDQSGMAENLDGMAGVAQGQSQPSRAARFGGAASALRESISSPRPPAFQEEADKTMASAREALGEDAFAAAWDAGRAMSWEQAVEYALSDTE